MMFTLLSIIFVPSQHKRLSIIFDKKKMEVNATTNILTRIKIIIPDHQTKELTREMGDSEKYGNS